MHLKNERFSYLSGAKPPESDSSANAIDYNPIPGRLEWMAKHKVMKKKDQAVLKKDWREDVQLSTKFKYQWPAFSKMLEEFKRVWDGHLECITVAKHTIDLSNNDIKPVHYAAYQAGLTTGKLTAAGIAQINTDKVIEWANTKWAAENVFPANKDGFLCFCVDCQTLNQIRLTEG